jgi:hypothetical protein
VKVAYFTAGTVGAGHLVRGAAIGRALLRAGFDGTYRMFGPVPPFAALAAASYETVPVQSDSVLRHRHLAQTSELAHRLDTYDPDLLLVDLFWAPLRWVLPGLACEAWLLVRSCPDGWLLGRPDFAFAREQYRRIIGIEPNAHAAVSEAIDPMVVANPEECRPPEALRDHLGMPAERPVKVVVHAGERGELAELLRVGGDGAVILDLFEPPALYPAAEWLGGADRIVSGCGYNAFWEARWLGYAERTEWVPFRRSIDDQARRLADCRSHRPRANGADTLAHWILR